MTRAFLGLGSNMGNKVENLMQAIQLLEENPALKVERIAGLYKTAPYGYLEQDWFLNTAVEVETSLSPRELLQTIHDVEQRLGRQRTIHWGPRTIDIDILTFGEYKVEEPDLTIPHKEIGKRAFVLIPLAELEPDLSIGSTTVKLALKTLQENEGKDTLGVTKYQGN